MLYNKYENYKPDVRECNYFEVYKNYDMELYIDVSLLMHMIIYNY